MDLEHESSWSGSRLRVADRSQRRRRDRYPRGAPPTTLPPVPDVLLATDADWILDEVDAALADGPTGRAPGARRASTCRRAVAELDPDLVMLDLQIGNMGGMATCMAIRHEEGAGRLPHVRC